VSTSVNARRLTEVLVSKGVGMKNEAGKSVDLVLLSSSFAAVLKDLPQNSNHELEFQEAFENAADSANDVAVKIEQLNL
jgi:hypothetical protein